MIAPTRVRYITIEITMRPTSTPHPSSLRHRRIGRKVLQADRLARALSATKPKKTKLLWPMSSLRPKVIALVCAIVIGVGAIGFTGSQVYFAQVDKTQKAAAAERQSKLEAKSIAADACRREKAEQKADQIGKITYDELYDYGECEK